MKTSYLQFESNAQKCPRLTPAGQQEAAPSGLQSSMVGSQNACKTTARVLRHNSEQTRDRKASPGRRAHHVGTGACKRHVLGVELQAADGPCVFTV